MRKFKFKSEPPELENGDKVVWVDGIGDCRKLYRSE